MNDAKINFALPAGLKTSIEAAASQAGETVASWLRRAARLRCRDVVVDSASANADLDEILRLTMRLELKEALDRTNVEYRRLIESSRDRSKGDPPGEEEEKR